MTHVPYKGTGQAMPDLLSGRVQLLFNSAVQAMPYVKNEQLRALAVTTAHRVAVVPDLPTMAEAGVPGYEFVSWYGVLVPTGTPQAVVTTLSVAIARAVQQPYFRDRLARDGAEAIGSSPARFAAHLKAEMGRWSAVAKATGMKVQ